MPISVLCPCLAYWYVYCLEVKFKIKPLSVRYSAIKRWSLPQSTCNLNERLHTVVGYCIYDKETDEKKDFGRHYCPGILQAYLSVLIDTDFVLVYTQQSDLESAVWISLSLKVGSVRLTEILIA